MEKYTSVFKRKIIIDAIENNAVENELIHRGILIKGNKLIIIKMNYE